MQINLSLNKRTSDRESDVPKLARNQFGAAVARPPGYAERIVDPALATVPNVRTSPKPILSNIMTLSVSPVEEDHASLKYAITQRSYWTPYTRATWTVSKADTVRSAATIIRKTSLPSLFASGICRTAPGGMFSSRSPGCPIHHI